MQNNVLIAVDGSRNSLRAVEYAGRVFAANAEARLVLFHVLPAISRTSLNREEIRAIEGRKAERADLADLYWQLEDEEKMSRFFKEATNLLVQVGVEPEQVESKFGVKDGEIAPAILEEVKRGHYETLIVGRRGQSRMREFFLGSISTELVREAQGCAVCVVE